MKTIITLVSAFLFWSCAVTVKTAYEPQVDFSAYKSFCWLESCEFTFSGPKYLNDTIVRQNLQRAIISEMQKKGLNFLSDNPDLLLDVHVVMETDTAYVYHRHDDMVSKPFANIEEEQIRMLRGTLVVDMVDRKSGSMVWRSKAISYLELFPDLTEVNFRKGVALALKKFPPKKR